MNRATWVPLVALAACGDMLDDAEEHCAEIEYSDGRRWRSCEPRSSLIDPLLAPIEISVAPLYNGEPVVDGERLLWQEGYVITTVLGTPLTSEVDHDTIVMLEANRSPRMSFVSREENGLIIDTPGSSRTVTISPSLDAYETRRLHGRLVFETARDPESWPIGEESAGTWSIPQKAPPGKPCVVDADCADDHLCTTDKCVDGFCENMPVVCDDGDLCTTDECDQSTGDCVYTPKVCDLGGWCTAGDICDPATGLCPETKDCDKCDPASKCEQSGAQLSAGPYELDLPCGPFGRIKGRFEGSGQVGKEVCPCPHCFEQRTGSLKVKADGEFCGLGVENFTGEAHASEKDQYCSACNKQSCKEQCTQLKEITKQKNVKAEIKFWEKPIPFGLPKWLDFYLFRITFGGEIKLKAEAGGHGSHSAKEAVANQQDCQGADCTNVKVGATFTGSGSGDLFAQFCVLRDLWCSPKIEVKKALYALIKANGDVSLQWGRDCPTEGCLTGNVTGEAGGNPHFMFTFRRRTYCVQAKLAIKFTCWRNFCANPFKCRVTVVTEAGSCL